MKWKNNIMFAAYFIGSIYGLALEEQPNKLTHESGEICHNICSKPRDINIKKGLCTCSNSDDKTSLETNPPLVHDNIETTAKHEGGTKTKRQTIKELINKKNKIIKAPTKPIKLISTEKPSTRFRLTKQFQKPQLKLRTSGIFSNSKQSPRIKDLEDRMKNLKARYSISPKFQSRSAFSNDDKTKNLIKQLKDRRGEILSDFKTLQSKTAIGKDSGILKEKVGSINYLQNRIDNVASIKDKLKERADERKNKFSEGSKKSKGNEEHEIVGSVHKHTTTTVTPKPTSDIPELVLGHVESTGPKPEPTLQMENGEEPGKSEAMEAGIKTMDALDKIKEKQKEAVMKIKDKLTVVKNKSKL